MSTSETSSGRPALTLAQASKLLSDPMRWKLLRVMSKGERVPLPELAGRVGCSTDSLFKHLMVLREFGVVVQRYRGLYVMAPSFMPAAGATTMDLGHCVVRLDTPLE